jgi:hypothetical protein
MGFEKGRTQTDTPTDQTKMAVRSIQLMYAIHLQVCKDGQNSGLQCDELVKYYRGGYGVLCTPNASWELFAWSKLMASNWNENPKIWLRNMLEGLLF